MINTINHEYAFYLGAIVIVVLGLYKASGQFRLTT
jgi:hypothetical protein